MLVVRTNGKNFGLVDTGQTELEREYSSRERGQTSKAIMLTINGTSCNYITASQSTGTSHFPLRHFTTWKAGNATIGVAYPPTSPRTKTHWQIEVEGRNLDDFTHERNRKTIKGHTMPWFKQELFVGGSKGYHVMTVNKSVSVFITFITQFRSGISLIINSTVQRCF
jgi:hypothetical protein